MKKVLLMILLIIIVASASGGGVWYWQKGILEKEKTKLTNEINDLQKRETQGGTNQTAQKNGNPVIIYAQEIKTTDSGSRLWQTVRILRKIGNTEPETLAEVGKVGEYPLDYVLSQDKKFLLINLESKLQTLDLTTKELKDLSFAPKKRIDSALYSSDGKQIFIWDDNPSNTDKSYYAHLFTISSSKDQILKQGNLDNPSFGILSWRDDNKIILAQKAGESAIPYYFDLDTNQLVKNSGNYDYIFSTLSVDGKEAAVVKGAVGDACNAFSGSTPGSYNIIEPISGNIVGVIDGLGDAVAGVNISPDGKEVIYQTNKPRNDNTDCNKAAEPNYFKVTIGTGQPVGINNPSDVLKSWGIDYVGATITTNSSTQSILLNGQQLITSDKELRIVAQFYQ